MPDFIVTQKKGMDLIADYLRTQQKPQLVSIKEYQEGRSLAQNALFHVWMNELSKHYYLTHGTLYSPKVWKEYLKSKLLGIETINTPDGFITRDKRTRDLKKKEMTEFMEAVQYYCHVEFGIVLNQPVI